MVDGYHKLFNAHAWAEVDRMIDVPDAALGIGFAENQRPQPKQMTYTPAVPTVKQPPVQSYNDTLMDGQSAFLKIGDFPLSGYIGEAYGGF